MANATAKVDVKFSELQQIEQPLKGGTARTFYEGVMVGFDTGGYIVKCDDAAKVQFLGLAAEKKEVLAADADGAKTLKIWIPNAFEVTLTSVANTDHGKPVFAAFDNQVQFTIGTYENLVGNVICRVSANKALVAARKGASGMHVTDFNVTAGGNNARLALAVNGQTMTMIATMS